MNKRHVFLMVLLGLSALLIHCDSCLLSCDPGPFDGRVSVKITINDENPAIPIEIYEGNFDNGILVMQDTVEAIDTENGRVYYYLEANYYYTVTATYQQGAKTIIAIDGSELGLEYDECDCGFPSDLTLNVRLAR